MKDMIHHFRKQGWIKKLYRSSFTISVGPPPWLTTEQRDLYLSIDRIQGRLKTYLANYLCTRLWLS